MEEIWKDIKNYNGYQISNLGRVRTHNKTTHTTIHGDRVWKDRILKPKISKKDKCSRIELWKDGTHKTFLIHRLVADAFLEEKIDTNLTVNHKDGNRLNNRVDNLEWITRADNIRHGFNLGLYHNQTKVKLINKNNNCERVYRSMSEASKIMNKNSGYVSNNIKRNVYENKDFKWEVA